MNAKEKLIQVMKRRKWYRDILPPANARSIKSKILADEGVSDEKIREILMKLGYKPKIEEQW